MKRASSFLSFTLFFSFSLFVSSPAFPHGGGLDAYGCPHNRKLGGYHCHRGSLAGQSFASKEEMLKKLSAEKTNEPPAKEQVPQPK